MSEPLSYYSTNNPAYMMYVIALTTDLTFALIILARTDIDYNNANCAGQNGVSNAAAVPGGAQYSGGVLTTTGAATGMTTTAAITTTSSSTLIPST